MTYSVGERGCWRVEGRQASNLQAKTALLGWPSLSLHAALDTLPWYLVLVASDVVES